MRPVAPLTVHLKASRRLLAIQLAAHVVAGASVLVSSIPGVVAAAMLILVGGSLARLRNRPLPERLVLRDAGHFETVDADGAVTEAVVHPHSVVLGSLVVLLYRQQGRIRALVLADDSLAREDARDLRLWLRWRASAVQPA